MTMMHEIKQLIKDEKIEEAISLLLLHDKWAIILQAKYNNGKSQKNKGLIDNVDWRNFQQQVSYAALEMAAQIEKNQKQMEDSPEKILCAFFAHVRSELAQSLPPEKVAEIFTHPTFVAAQGAFKKVTGLG
jgi:hypothetical protein